MIVDHRRQQIVGRGDGMKIAGKMQVHILHRNDLGISAACRTALDAKTGAKRGFANTDGGFLADAVQPVPKPDSGGRLAFTGRRWIDCCHQDQSAHLVVFYRPYEVR